MIRTKSTDLPLPKVWFLSYHWGDKKPLLLRLTGGGGGNFMKFLLVSRKVSCLINRAGRTVQGKSRRFDVRAAVGEIESEVLRPAIRADSAVIA